MTREELKDFVSSRPFKVHKVELEGIKFLAIKGDKIVKPESWVGKGDIIVANYQNDEDLPSRIIDLKDDYKDLTKTDGSKVNWDYGEK